MIHVEHVVVLVVDNNHQRYGQLAKLLWYDWKEYGIYCVQYSDGKTEEFREGEDSCIKRFFRYNGDIGRFLDKSSEVDLGGPERLKKKYIEELKIGNLEELLQKYFELFQENLV